MHVSVDLVCIKFGHVCALQQECEVRIDNKKKSVPSAQDVAGFRQCLQKGASALFNTTTGLPLQSSPVCTISFCCAYLLALLSQNFSLTSIIILAMVLCYCFICSINAQSPFMNTFSLSLIIYLLQNSTKSTDKKVRLTIVTEYTVTLNIKST